MSETSPAEPKDSLTFKLDVVDQWPPVAVACIPVTATGDQYEVGAAPLFVKGLSVGDVIVVDELHDGQVMRWHHLRISGNSTVWLLRQSEGGKPELLASLRELGCHTTWSGQCGVASVQVPAQVAASELDRRLLVIEQAGFAVAYPSWRHEEI